MEKRTPALGGLGLSCISHLLSVFFYFIIYLFWQSLSTAAHGLILVKVELELEKLSPVEMSGWAF